MIGFESTYKYAYLQHRSAIQLYAFTTLRLLILTCAYAGSALVGGQLLPGAGEDPGRGGGQREEEQGEQEAPLPGPTQEHTQVPPLLTVLAQENSTDSSTLGTTTCTLGSVILFDL